MNTDAQTLPNFQKSKEAICKNHQVRFIPRMQVQLNKQVQFMKFTTQYTKNEYTYNHFSRLRIALNKIQYSQLKKINKYQASSTS